MSEIEALRFFFFIARFSQEALLFFGVWEVWPEEVRPVGEGVWSVAMDVWPVARAAMGEPTLGSIPRGEGKGPTGKLPGLQQGELGCMGLGRS